jgi:hypothetical protein
MHLPFMRFDANTGDKSELNESRGDDAPDLRKMVWLVRLVFI